MAHVKMKELLEAGVHFGHQTRRWNPKMRQYIFGVRNGIYIVDLQKTVKMFKLAYDFILNVVGDGNSILFVGTKKQARDSVYEEANRAEMFYVHNRWLGGMLTNFQTIRKRVGRLNYLNKIENDGTIGLFPKKERLRLGKERCKLDGVLGGIRNMSSLPAAIFIVDPKNEAIAIREGKRLGIPIIAIVDTNCNPDDVDFVIPGNDDAIRAIRLITSRIADACILGRKRFEESQQAQLDKEVVFTNDVNVKKDDLSNSSIGGRRVVPSVKNGPVVEIIRKNVIDVTREDDVAVSEISKEEDEAK